METSQAISVLLPNLSEDQKAIMWKECEETTVAAMRILEKLSNPEGLADSLVKILAAASAQASDAAYRSHLPLDIVNITIERAAESSWKRLHTKGSTELELSKVVSSPDQTIRELMDLLVDSSVPARLSSLSHALGYLKAYEAFKVSAAEYDLTPVFKDIADAYESSLQRYRDHRCGEITGECTELLEHIFKNLSSRPFQDQVRILMYIMLEGMTRTYSKSVNIDDLLKTLVTGFHDMFNHCNVKAASRINRFKHVLEGGVFDEKEFVREVLSREYEGETILQSCSNTLAYFAKSHATGTRLNSAYYAKKFSEGFMSGLKKRGFGLRSHNDV